MAFLSEEVKLDNISEEESISFNDFPKSWLNDIKTDPHVKFFYNKNISRVINHKKIYDINAVYLFENLKDTDLVGIIIVPFSKTIDGYAAIIDDRSNFIDSSYGLGEVNPKNILFSNAIDKWTKELNTCNLCQKSVGYINLMRYSFAGKCCGDCLPKARAEYEQPGWYN